MSLRHLQTLPFEKIKVDRSFVLAMAPDPESDKIVSAIIGLGRSLGLAIVAEGIETAELARKVGDLGCDLGQGWLFGHPASADQTEVLFREQRAGKANLSLVA